jgi:4'-phosphopantetheinyl transferase
MMIADDEIHIWTLRTNQPDHVIEKLVKWLSPDERHRAEQFATPILRSLFTIHRASLRILLGKALGIPPDHFAFVYGAYGKPQILGRLVEPNLEFNLSHSKGIAVVAIALGREVGIDIECFHSSFDAEKLVDRFFCPSERQAYLDVAEVDRAALFLQAWTRKEAHLKATGDGLSFPLNGVEVSLGIGVPPQLLRVEGRPTDPKRWSMIDLGGEPGCIGALVAKGGGWRVRQSMFDPSASGV